MSAAHWRRTLPDDIAAIGLLSRRLLGPYAEHDFVFEERLADRNYRALFDARVIQVMTDAAEHLEKHGLGDEIGALRFVLARLLAEEEDLSRLAGNVSRVVSVAVAAAKAQRAINGEVAHGLVEAFTQILLEVNGDE